MLSILVFITLARGPIYGANYREDENEFFFHRNEMKNPNDWPLLTIGMKVTFMTGMDRRGPNAIAVDIQDTNRQTGTIARIPAGQEYGFIRAVNGIEYYFHFKSILAPEDAKPQIGDKVRFALGENNQGSCAVDVTIE